MHSLSILWKRRLGAAWKMRARLHNHQTQARILLYHSVGPGQFSTPVLQFAKQMRFLSESATVFPLESLIAGERAASGLSVAITWDDGYSGVFEYAFPLLQRFGFPSTVYITTAAIRESIAQASHEQEGLIPSLKMLTWNQIRELQRSGFNIGSHMVHHRDVRQLGDAELFDELLSSRSVIEQKTGKACRDFAYPWGLWNSRSADTVARAAYRSAVTTEPRPLGDLVNFMAIPRVDISPQYTFLDFRAILRGDWDYLRHIHRLKSALGMNGPLKLPVQREPHFDRK